MTWLFDVAQYHPFHNHERVVLVRYESLVSRPYALVSSLLRRITGQDLDPQELEQRFLHNRYRAVHSKKIATWSVRQYGTVQDANRKEIAPDHLRDLAALPAARIAPNWAEHFGLPAVGFRELVESLGYAETVDQMLSSVEPAASLPRLTRRDRVRLAYKWAKDLSAGDAGLGEVWAFQRPFCSA